MDPLARDLLNGIKASYNNEFADRSIRHLSNETVLELIRDWLYQELDDAYTEVEENEDKENIEKDPEFKASYDDIAEALSEKRHQRIESKISEKDGRWLFQYLKKNLKERFNVFFMNDCSKHSEIFLANGILCGGNWNYLSRSDLEQWYIKFLFKDINKSKNNSLNMFFSGEFLTVEETKYVKDSYKIVKSMVSTDDGKTTISQGIDEDGNIAYIERIRDPIEGVSRESMISFILQRQEMILKNAIKYLETEGHDIRTKLTHNDRDSIDSIIKEGLPFFERQRMNLNKKKVEVTKVQTEKSESTI